MSNQEIQSRKSLVSQEEQELEEEQLEEVTGGKGFFGCCFGKSPTNEGPSAPNPTNERPSSPNIPQPGLGRIPEDHSVGLGGIVRTESGRNTTPEDYAKEMSPGR